MFPETNSPPNHSNSMLLEDDNDDDFLSDNHGLFDSLPPAPDSLLSNSLPRSLLQGSFLSANSESQHIPYARPRTLWNIQDSGLQHIPKFYPPLNPNCTTFVGDAAPSVVAYRIVECLRKRSIAVEYDDDLISAFAMTVDRCYFQIQLWKGNVTPTVDFSQGVVVECTRLRGNTISFHKVCRAILSAAKGEMTGEDSRKFYQTNGIEYQRLVHSPAQQHREFQEQKDQISSSNIALHALEKVRELLKKDRLECQELAMERLINLTTPSTCGIQNANDISFHILQEEWLYSYIVNDAQNEKEDDQKIRESSTFAGSSPFKTALPRPSLLQRGDTSSPSHQMDRINRCINEVRHDTKIRAFALRVLCNALTNLSDNGNLLESQILQTKDSPLTKTSLLRSLVEDLKGVNRPLTVVEAGDRLASIHETVFVIRCLRILAEKSTICKNYLQSDSVMDQLEIVRSCGRATHLILQKEAEEMYSKLTKDVRSC